MVSVCLVEFSLHQSVKCIVAYSNYLFVISAIALVYFYIYCVIYWHKYQ